MLYPLPEVLLVVLCGTLAGAEDFVEIRQWAGVNLDFLRRILPFEAGLPSHDTLNDVIKAIDDALFSQCFTAWVEGLRGAAPNFGAPAADGLGVIAIEGKTSRRTHDRSKDRGPLHLVSAWTKLVKVPGQNGALLRSRSDWNASGGCQTRIAQAILDRGDYLLAVKDNQPSLPDEVQGGDGGGGEREADRPP